MKRALKERISMRAHPAKSMKSAYDVTTLSWHSGSARIASLSTNVNGCDICIGTCWRTGATISFRERAVGVGY